MEYKIGDVSKYLNLSDQMIRYYEKCGVINPKRSGDGKYRYYTEMDVFLLFDAMRYTKWNINIAEVKSLVENNYFDNILQRMEEFHGQLEKKISYDGLLKTRMEDMIKKIQICKYNIGNYWVEEIPLKRLLYSGTSRGDNYNLKEGKGELLKMVYDSENIPFFDVLIEFGEDEDQWWYAIDEKYCNTLEINEKSKMLEKQYCVCTIVDMGEFGEFDKKCLEMIKSYMRKNEKYEQNGIPFGIIIGRGVDEGKFKRLMEIHIPIKTI